MNQTTSRTLLIAGTVSYDYLLFPMTINGRIAQLDLSDGEDASRLVIRTGAAALVARILTAAAPRWGFEVLGPNLQQPPANCLSNNASSVIDLAFRDKHSHAVPAYRVVRSQLIDKDPIWHSPSIEAASIAKAATVIISGSGESFKDIEPALDFLERVKPRYIVHHMTRPLAKGALWDIIRDGPRTRDGIPEPDFLAIIVDADDLRAQGISLSRSLSWEATAEDFVRNLGSNGKLDTLVTCPNLIVRFGNEAVIHHRGRDASDPKIYLNPRQIENGGRPTSGKGMIGLASAFTAGFALGFADSSPPNVDKGVRMGIAAARRMENDGFVMSVTEETPDYPIDAIVHKLEPESRVTVVNIPSARISSGDSWNILEAVTGDPSEVARQVVTLGPEIALGPCPMQKFGDLLSFERREQESLRAVLDAVQERVASNGSQPTSVGIFGPSGSGKNFVASNLVKRFTIDRDVKQLTYNARSLRHEDLLSLCHTIRDNTAAGTLTVVFFENFEAILEPGNALLNDFLVIMHDGLFTDKAHIRTLGHPLLFFLVNRKVPVQDVSLSHETADYHSAESGESLLLDYLHGLVRIKGPNQVNAQDDVFSIRRAIMLRHMLKQKFPHLEIDGKINVDEAVLHALLLVPTYKHGLKSLDKILSTSRLSNRTKFDVSALPPEEQIQLHVDGKVFMSYLRSPKLPGILREKLAQGLFIAYKTQRERMAKTEAEKQALASDPAMCDWDELSGELKESTRAQADDIPRKLRAVRCFMLEDQTRTEPLIHVPEFSTEELDMLAEMEHERFNAERLQRQWRMGPRSSSRRTTPFLVPYRDLTQEWKDVDRVMVECVPKVLASAGWRIYRMQQDF